MGCTSSKQNSVPADSSKDDNSTVNTVNTEIPPPPSPLPPYPLDQIKPELPVSSDTLRTPYLDNACVDNNLGIFSILSATRQTTYEDLPGDYIQTTADYKRNILWSNIIKDPYTYDVLPVSPDPLAATYLLNPLYLMTTFTLESDAVPGGRTKVFYPFGAAAKVTFKADDASPYSGIFKTGALGIIRFSLSAPVTSATDIATPAIALKLLIDGKPSQNLFAFNSAEGTTDRNFFRKEFSTAAGKPHQAITAVGDIFGVAARLLPRRVRPVNGEVIPTIGPASVTSSGNTVDTEKVVKPYKVIFTPSDDVKELMEPADLTDFRTQLNWIPPSAILFNVSACKENEDPVSVGVLILDSSIVASRYVDEFLFFQHPLFK